MDIGPINFARLLIVLGFLAVCAVLSVFAAGQAFKEAFENLRFRIRMKRMRPKGWAAGMCVRCGYDVRACAERCSECGEAIQRMKAPPKKLL